MPDTASVLNETFTWRTIVVAVVLALLPVGKEYVIPWLTNHGGLWATVAPLVLLVGQAASVYLGQLNDS